MIPPPVHQHIAQGPPCRRRSSRLFAVPVSICLSWLESGRLESSRLSAMVRLSSLEAYLCVNPGLERAVLDNGSRDSASFACTSFPRTQTLRSIVRVQSCTTR